MTHKRGYSKEFTPKPGSHARYLLDKIPAALWRSANAKAKREGLSMRALILRLLTEWLSYSPQTEDETRDERALAAFTEGQKAWPKKRLIDNPYDDRSDTPKAEAWERGWLKTHYANLKTRRRWPHRRI